MRGGFQAVRAEIAAFQRMALQLFAGTAATMLVGFAGVIATIITQT